MKVKSPKIEDVEECLLAVPRCHRHLRLALRYGDEVLILPEAVVAVVVRAYLTVQTHPQRRAIHLVAREVPNAKHGFAARQLLEQETPDEEIEKRLHDLLQLANPPAPEVMRRRELSKS